MQVNQLELENFRNYEHLSLAFSPNINIFIGQNAQGKTNLLEAIYFLALTRSHRSQKDTELIRFEQDFATISGKISKSQIDLRLAIKLNATGKKALVNQLEQRKLSDYLGKLTAILFSPEDLTLVKGSPQARRKFMDWEFGQLNYQYLYYLSQYRQILKQKNNYLKQLYYKRASDELFLDVLSDQLAGVAAEIIHLRLMFVEKLNKYANNAQKKISAKDENLEIKYQTNVENISTKSTVDDIYQQLLKQFSAIKQKEIKQGTTLIGPHRDDLQFFVDGLNAQNFGSQGQQRTIVLSLKLAEIDLAFELTQEYPILLLDDVLSELDGSRQTALLNYIQDKTQTFITSTDLNSISKEIIKNPNVFEISNGSVKPLINKE